MCFVKNQDMLIKNKFFLKTIAITRTRNKALSTIGNAPLFDYLSPTFIIRLITNQITIISYGDLK